MNDEIKVVTFKVDRSLSDSFSVACRNNDTTASRELRRFMREFVAKKGQNRLFQRTIKKGLVETSPFWYSKLATWDKTKNLTFPILSQAERVKQAQGLQSVTHSVINNQSTETMANQLKL